MKQSAFMSQPALLARAHGIGRLIYLLGGPLTWLTSFLVITALGASRCIDGGTLVLVNIVAVCVCAALMYRALSRVRRLPVENPDRLRHFFAGGLAVLGMAGIGGTAMMTALSTVCPVAP